jgi:hypothetical protein
LPLGALQEPFSDWAVGTLNETLEVIIEVKLFRLT